MFLQGGASHIDMYDMKPDMPEGIRGKYQPSPTKIPGVHLSDQLPKLSNCADKFSLIRSMHSYSFVHGEGDVHMMCGSPVDKNVEAPGIGAVLSLQQRQQSPIPPFVHLGNMKHPAHSMPSAARFLGRTNNSFIIHKDPNSPDFAVSEFDVAPAVDLDRLAGRRQLRRSLDCYQAERERPLEYAVAHDIFTEQALNLATSRKAKDALICPKSQPNGVMLVDVIGFGQGML